MNIRQIILGVVAGLVIHVGAAAPLISGVSAQQQSSGFVDITVTMEGASNDVAEAICTFVATNSATKAAIPIEHITRNGGDVGSDSVWTRKFVWDAKADVGEVKIDDVALTVVVELPLGGVQLWENGPYWAECNVGAMRPEECGYYFWWGDTVGYKRNSANDGWVSVKNGSSFSFSKEACMTYGKSNSQLLTAGYIDANDCLVATHDAATVHLGTPWRMPTDAEFSALVNNCDTEWTARNGVSGRLVKGRGAYASKSIFFPAAGDGYDSFLYNLDSFGIYWSACTPIADLPNDSWVLDFDSLGLRKNVSDRYFGQPVRPVCEYSNTHEVVGSVATHLALDLSSVGGAWVKSVTAECSLNGFVDITVTFQGSEEEVADADCLFFATNSETKAAIPIEHITRNGGDVGSDSVWTRKFIWDAKADVGEVKIDDVALTVAVELPLGGVQLWENGPYWAECNVGATKPEECGYYFWWGDTVGYKYEGNSWNAIDGSKTGFSFSGEDCPTYGKSKAQLQSAGYIDSTGNLVARSDAAVAHLGIPWRMPTDAEVVALVDKCDTEWTSRNGVAGRLVKGRGVYASKCIFLPAAGQGDGTDLSSVGSYGNYWSSTLDFNNSNYAPYLRFYVGGFSRYCGYGRYNGRPVRPVRGFNTLTDDTVLCVTIHLALDFGAQPLPEGGPYTETVDGVAWTFTVNADLKASVGGGSVVSTAVSQDLQGTVTVPDVLGGRCVTSVGDYSFFGCGQLMSVCFGDSIRKIGKRAFENCVSLKSLVFPDNLICIGERAFYNCRGVTYIKFPECLKSIDTEAFGCCVGLTSVTLPGSVGNVSDKLFSTCSGLQNVDLQKGVTNIGRHAFGSCWNLKSIVIPEGVTDIKGEAFYDCRAMTDVAIPSSVTNIENGAFSSCTGLEMVHIEDLSAWCRIRFVVESSNPTYCSKRLSIEDSEIRNLIIPDGVAKIEDMVFCNCTNIISVVLPDSLKSIGAHAFRSCTGIGKLTIPSSIDRMGVYAFGGCVKLLAVDFEGAPPEGVSVAAINPDASIRYSAQYANEWLPVIAECGWTNATPYTPESADEPVESLPKGGPYTETVDGVEWTFMVNSDLTVSVGGGSSDSTGVQVSMTGDVSVPTTLGGRSVTSVGPYAFYDCRGLTSVSIPNGVTNISERAFAGCTSLRNAEIPSTVENIGSYAFNGCTSLMSVTLPNDLRTISNSAFRRCKALTSISIPHTVTSIGNDSFEECVGLTLVDIPSAVTSIGAYAFSGCEELATVELHEGLERIGESAFSRCSKLSSYSIPISVLSVSRFSFNGTKRYLDISAAAADCIIMDDCLFCLTSTALSNIKNLAVPSGVRVIADNAFVDATNLESATLPDTVRAIGASSFYGSTISSITIPTDSVRIIGNSAFEASHLIDVDIPDGVETIMDRAFAKCDKLKTVTIAGTVKSIGASCFSQSYYVQSVSLGEGVETVGREAFLDMGYQWVYWNGSNSVKIDIPSTITKIGASAFSGTGYRSVAANVADIATWCEAEFADASSVPWHQQYGGKIDHFTYPDLKIPYGPSRISSYAFAFWNYGGSIDLPRSVKRIESNAFYSSKMVSILIPSTVAEIEKGAFDYCSNLKTIYVSENDTARVKEMMRGMMNIVNGKSVEMNVDDWEFIEISAVEFSTAESVAEVFGDGSAMAECVKDPTQLAAFNTFISDCGITSVESISAAQKQYAYQSFKLAEITTAPRLFEEEPVLKIDDLELSAEEMSFTISLTAGSEAIELAYEKLAQKIRVGTSLDSIVAPPEINPRPSADGTSLTFTISKPEGNQGFVKVQID